MATDWDSKQSKLAQTFLPCGPIFFWQWLFRQQDKDLHDLIYDDVISFCGWSWNHGCLSRFGFHNKSLVLTTTDWFRKLWKPARRIGTWVNSYSSSFPIHQSALIFAECLLLCARWISALQNWAFTFPNRPSTTTFLNRPSTIAFLNRSSTIDFVGRNTRRPIKPWTILVHHFNLPLWACREFSSDRGNLAQVVLA